MTYKDIYTFHGWREQCKHILEETYELAEAIHDYEIDENPAAKIVNFNNITEEIADIEIMLEEIKQHYGIKKANVGEWKSYKFNREVERIKNGYYTRGKNSRKSN